MSLQNILSLFKFKILVGLAFFRRCWSFGVFPLLCSFFSVFFQWIAKVCEALSTASTVSHTGSWQLATSNFLSLSTCIICDWAQPSTTELYFQANTAIFFSWYRVWLQTLRLKQSSFRISSSRGSRYAYLGLGSFYCQAKIVLAQLNLLIFF